MHVMVENRNCRCAILIVKSLRFNKGDQPRRILVSASAARYCDSLPTGAGNVFDEF